MPAAANPSASSAKPPTSQAIERGAATDAATTVSILAILLTAQFGQTSLIISGRRLSKLPGSPPRRTTRETDWGICMACAMGDRPLHPPNRAVL